MLTAFEVDTAALHHMTTDALFFPIFWSSSHRLSSSTGTDAVKIITNAVLNPMRSATAPITGKKTIIITLKRSISIRSSSGRDHGSILSPNRGRSFSTTARRSGNAGGS